MSSSAVFKPKRSELFDAFGETLNSLKDAIANKPPVFSGVLPVSKEHLRIYFNRSPSPNVLENASYLRFPDVPETALKLLSDACDPATFGLDDKDVLDESYRKAGKLDADNFSTTLDPQRSGLTDIVRYELLSGRTSLKPISTELYKLNVYGPGSFFKTHKDTPRAENMFGSLVIVLPTKFQGGELKFGHQGKEWIFDSANEIMKSRDPSCVAYSVFFSDVDHEVLPVQSGYRVTLTYNLYFDKEYPTPMTRNFGLDLPEEIQFKSALSILLSDPTFLPSGGYLGFGLQHQYPLDKAKGTLDHLSHCIKGSDATIVRVCETLNLKTHFKIAYFDESHEYGKTLVLLDTVVDKQFHANECSLSAILYARYEGKVAAHKRGSYSGYFVPVNWPVHWISDLNDLTRHTISYTAYGNEHSSGHAYGDICLIVEIGPVQDRAASPMKEVTGQKMPKGKYLWRGASEKDKQDYGQD